MLNVTFFGVRGSTPCSGEGTQRYGGNTSCVALEVPGREPILLDLGTGARYFGSMQPAGEPFRGSALVTHLHWDHVQGLPFFSPIMRPGARLDIYAPPPADGSGLREAFGAIVGPPTFPVTLDDLAGEVAFHGVEPGTFMVGDAAVTCCSVPHLGPTNGYRVTWGGATVAYVSDHQEPLDGSGAVDAGVLELARDVDLLIHDAQFTADEFAEKGHWGHCTGEYALAVAKAAGARRLALFHHDPGRHDDELDRLWAGMAVEAAGEGIELLVASEGLTVSFDAAAADRPADVLAAPAAIDARARR